MQCVDIVKGLPEPHVILPGKPSDQIQMHMDIMPGANPGHNLRDSGKVHLPVNRLHRLRAGGLHTDLQLYLPRAKSLQNRQHFLVDQIRRDLKMEVRDTVVMLRQKAPDCQGMGLLTIKGTIDKLHLRHLLFQEKGQLLLHLLRGPEAQAPVNRGQTVAAGKGTAPAALIINNPVLEFRQIPVPERNLRKWNRLLRQACRQFILPPLRIRLRQTPKGILTGSRHDSANRQRAQTLRHIIGDFRTTHPDIGLRQHSGEITDKCLHDPDIPDITGEPDHIRMPPVNIRPDLPDRLIDRVFCNLDRRLPLSGTGLQAMYRRI